METYDFYYYGELILKIHENSLVEHFKLSENQVDTVVDKKSTTDEFYLPVFKMLSKINCNNKHNSAAVVSYNTAKSLLKHISEEATFEQ